MQIGVGLAQITHVLTSQQRRFESDPLAHNETQKQMDDAEIYLGTKWRNQKKNRSEIGQAKSDLQ